MCNVEFQEIYTDKKICLCGCGKSTSEENWGLKVIIEGSINSVEECFQIVEMFEKHLDKLKDKTTVCKYCGNCCSHGPELSQKELEYLLNKFPEYKKYYDQINSGVPCPLGGKNKGPCILPIDARPLQCRILFCEANIVGFERFYNFLGKYLNWTVID